MVGILLKGIVPKGPFQTALLAHAWSLCPYTIALAAAAAPQLGAVGAVVMFDAGGVTFLQLLVIHRSQNRRPWVVKVSLVFPQGKAPLDRSVTTCSVSALHRSEQCPTRFYIACMCLGCFVRSR